MKQALRILLKLTLILLTICLAVASLYVQCKALLEGKHP